MVPAEIYRPPSILSGELPVVPQRPLNELTPFAGTPHFAGNSAGIAFLRITGRDPQSGRWWAGAGRPIADGPAL